MQNRERLSAIYGRVRVCYACGSGVLQSVHTGRVKQLSKLDRPAFFLETVAKYYNHR